MYSTCLITLSLIIVHVSLLNQLLYFSFLQCSFSRGGHLFAASNSNLVQVYSTFSFENTINLKGHNGKVHVECTVTGVILQCTCRFAVFCGVKMTPD